MSGDHVLVATMASKSTLRAVAGQVASQFDFVDYYPSYEIINSPPFRGSFFEPNQRGVNHVGVDHVMTSFFGCLSAKFPDDISSEKLLVDLSASRLKSKKRLSQTDLARREARQKKGAEKLRKLSQEKESSGDVVCEEELLNAFANKT